MLRRIEQLLDSSKFEANTLGVSLFQWIHALRGRVVLVNFGDPATYLIQLWIEPRSGRSSVSVNERRLLRSAG